MILTSNLVAVRLMLLINVIIMLSFPILGLVEWSFEKSLILLALYFVFDCLGIVMTYHRYHAHRGFEYKYTWMENLFTLFGMLSGSGSPLGWTNIHAEHHKHSDTLEDPHTPKHGVWRVLSVDYRYTPNQWSIRSIIVKPTQRHFHQYYFAYIIGYLVLLFSIFGLNGTYFGFTVPSVLILTAQGITNFVNHQERFGYRNFGFHDNSKNIWWMAPFNFGEGWHNNHHANPKNYTTKHKWWEFDIAGSIIKLVKE